ncbi:type II secretion system F family protein [Sinomonas sp. JGH33]|uniref:Type II secretion system F family protein n=1 Tax=Sinomonas terricola TaxID=3110330 RepID=A0ABU5T198_9MICC|nr:type II secretion system F family protein [Sinomonas sp. JGH33]MEA5453429.1 type II secretion system F family protein [Sinomonas sp. JGH33]
MAHVGGRSRVARRRVFLAEPAHQAEVLKERNMSFLALAAILAIVAPISLLTWSLITADRSTRKRVQLNLGLSKAIKKAPSSVPELVVGLSRRSLPTGYVAWLDKKLAGAGRPKSWPMEKVLVAKPIVALCLIILGLLAFSRALSPQAVLGILAVGAAGYFLPDLLLNNTAQKRRKAMHLALPNMLDQMLISVEAGVGFEGAMAKAAENSSGPLADEFVRTLQDIQVGRSRHEAYLDLAERCGFSELRSFIRAVVQADQYGIAIANVLRSQAKEMRLKRRQRAEEHAMKIPVKVLFPLVITILPAMFVIILGPPIINVIRMFS